MTPERPLLLPLGDRALLVRFGDSLDDAANRAAIAFAARLAAEAMAGITEIAPNLVSVLVGYEPRVVSFTRLCGEVSLLFGRDHAAPAPRCHRIEVRFGGAEGADLDEVGRTLGLSREDFIAVHNGAPLRVLATGFAPGFVYCGFHPESLRLPRRTNVRREVPAGSVLFAAGQTAIAATPIPTGWHVIGRTGFRNFDGAANPPTRLAPGDEIVFEALP